MAGHGSLRKDLLKMRDPELSTESALRLGIRMEDDLMANRKGGLLQLVPQKATH
jgi:hypothetical protein